MLWFASWHGLRIRLGRALLFVIGSPRRGCCRWGWCFWTLLDGFVSPRLLAALGILAASAQLWLSSRCSCIGGALMRLKNLNNLLCYVLRRFVGPGSGSSVQVLSCLLCPRLRHNWPVIPTWDRKCSWSQALCRWCTWWCRRETPWSPLYP